MTRTIAVTFAVLGVLIAWTVARGMSAKGDKIGAKGDKKGV